MRYPLQLFLVTVLIHGSLSQHYPYPHPHHSIPDPPPPHRPLPPPPHHNPPPPIPDLPLEVHHIPNPSPHHPLPPPSHHSLPPPSHYNPPPPPHYNLPPPPPPHHPIPDLPPEIHHIPDPPPPPHHPLPPPPHHPLPPPPHHPLPPPPHHNPPPPPHHPLPPPPHHPPPPPPPHHTPPSVPIHHLTPYKPIHHLPLPHSWGNDPFPYSFSFGVTSGAYHIEGAWDEFGKVPNIWDEWLHANPGMVIDGTNGDVASDSFHHLEEDVEILNNLTVNFYKFSISWSRIMTSCGEVNYAGIEYYERLITLLKTNQIDPVVTMYYGDLPQYLQDQGGFLNDQFPEWFTEYARVLFDNFGSLVKVWTTFHAPTHICHEGYGDGSFAPGINDNPGVNEYICGHNLLKAHANVYHLYDDFYRECQKGKISLDFGSSWYEPYSDCPIDIEAAERKLQFQLGWWAHPIYLGDYPKAVISQIGILSEMQGFTKSRLPIFTRKEIEWIKGTHDFFTLYFDDTYKVRDYCFEKCPVPAYDLDISVEVLPIDGDLTFGVRKLIVWIKNQYFNPSIIVHSGLSSFIRDFEDDDRITYIHDTLINIRAAMLNDDARVYGYSYYSYIDGFEWTDGNTRRWGLYDVDFDCPTRPRTARKSAEYFQQLAKYGCIDSPCNARSH